MSTKIRASLESINTSTINHNTKKRKQQQQSLQTTGQQHRKFPEIPANSRTQNKRLPTTNHHSTTAVPHCRTQRTE
jgi:hypothetical protein